MLDTVTLNADFNAIANHDYCFFVFLQASTPRTEIAGKAAEDIARYIRAVPSDKGREINITLYNVLIAVDEVTVERSVTLSYHEEEGEHSRLIYS